nr:S adenosylmethionine decarboxylase proenzyme [Hymenolepis microstoma]
MRNIAMMVSECQQNYEGAEKLLEIWFFGETGKSPSNLDLRHISRKDIEHVLDRACCTIVKENSNERQLSFVLSESSLFITKNRIILKTCGNTRLLETVEPLIKLASGLGFKYHRTYYSHCAFLFPDQQEEVYQDFELEVARLDLVYKNTGVKRTFGNLRSNLWHLYCGQSIPCALKEPSSQTLQLMMRGLSPAKMETFYARNSGSAEEATRCSGIHSLFPGANTADFLFEPCGYSVNGVMKADEYFTIHVTPEPEFSYVSVETNVAMANYTNFISRVLDIFGPSSFICTFISDSNSEAHGNHEDLKEVKLPNYRRVEISDWNLFGGKKVTYTAYEVDSHRRRNSNFGSDEESRASSLD